MATALLPVIAALTAGIQLVYSSAVYADGIAMKDSRDQQPPPLTPSEKRSLPRTSVNNLPSVAMIKKFPIDVRNTTYPEPNPAAKNINPDATLPADYYRAYLERQKGYYTIYPGRNQRYWMMDPNLNVGTYQAPLQKFVSANITPTPCNDNPYAEMVVQSSHAGHRHRQLGCR